MAKNDDIRQHQIKYSSNISSAKRCLFILDRLFSPNASKTKTEPCFGLSRTWRLSTSLLVFSESKFKMCNSFANKKGQKFHSCRRDHLMKIIIIVQNILMTKYHFNILSFQLALPLSFVLRPSVFHSLHQLNGILIIARENDTKLSCG